MTDTITESFCERCGTRYSFTRAAQRGGTGIGRVRVLGRGLKNYVVNDGLPMTEAMAAARDEEERAGTSRQLDAFHRAFSFCMTCRQYTCANCWNEKAGECLTCAPDLSREVLPAPFPDLPKGGPVLPSAAAEGSPAEHAESFAWPRADLDRESLRIDAAAEVPDAAVEPVAVVDETDLLARLDAAALPPASTELADRPEPAPEPGPPTELAVRPDAVPSPHAAADLLLGELEPTAEQAPEVPAQPGRAEQHAAGPASQPEPTEEELTATELAEIEGALAATRPLAEPEAVPVDSEAIVAEPVTAATAKPEEIGPPVVVAEPLTETSAPSAAAGEAAEAGSIDAALVTEAQPASQVDQVDVSRGQTRNLLRRFRPARQVPPPSTTVADVTPAPVVASTPAIAPRSAVAAVELAAHSGTGDAAEPATFPEPEIAAVEPAAAVEPRSRR